MIKEKCATAGVTYELRTEYARSGRSTCRGCLQKIKDVSINILEYLTTLHISKMIYAILK